LVPRAVNGDRKVDINDLVYLLDVNRDGKVDHMDLLAMGHALMERLPFHPVSEMERRARQARRYQSADAQRTGAQLFGAGYTAVPKEPTRVPPTPLRATVVDLVLPVGLREANSLLFSPAEAFTPRWWKKCGVREPMATDWERPAGCDSASRQITYTSPPTAFSRASPTKETQVFTVEEPHNGIYTVDVLLDPGPNVPFGTRFRIRWRYLLLAAQKDTTRLQLSYQLLWVKPCPIKGWVEKLTLAELRRVGKDMSALLGEMGFLA
jgi:hypothetical protein